MINLKSLWDHLMTKNINLQNPRISDLINFLKVCPICQNKIAISDCDFQDSNSLKCSDCDFQDSNSLKCSAKNFQIDLFKNKVLAKTNFAFLDFCCSDSKNYNSSHFQLQTNIETENSKIYIVSIKFSVNNVPYIHSANGLSFNNVILNNQSPSIKDFFSIYDIVQKYQKLIALI